MEGRREMKTLIILIFFIYILFGSVGKFILSYSLAIYVYMYDNI